jgi:hypothetical protein
VQKQTASHVHAHFALQGSRLLQSRKVTSRGAPAAAADAHSFCASQTKNTQFSDCGLNPCCCCCCCIGLVCISGMAMNATESSDVFHKKLPSEKSAERGNNKARAQEREREKISLWSSARQSKKLKVCGLGFAILVSLAPYPDCC